MHPKNVLRDSNSCHQSAHLLFPSLHFHFFPLYSHHFLKKVITVKVTMHKYL